MQPAPQKPIASTERVYQAVFELRKLLQPATREVVADLTQLKMTIVDDRLRALVDDGKLKRLVRGMYELVEVFAAPRAISKTILSDGTTVLDIGDDVLTLTPQESRILAELCIGSAHTALMIHTTNQHLFLATELTAKVEKLERQLKTAKQGKTNQDD